MKRVRRVLVTAGHTDVSIDQVRVISNIFNGRTGTGIARYFVEQGADVTLLTSNPLIARAMKYEGRCDQYRLFDELMERMEKHVKGMAYEGEEPYDVIIHSSAVSDYMVTKVLVPVGQATVRPGTEEEQEWYRLEQLDTSGKISSDHDTLCLWTQKTPKIVDFIREPWGFKGVLVKFKLQVKKSNEVELTDDDLIKIGVDSMHASKADHLVANFLESHGEYAYIIDAKYKAGGCERVTRDELATALWRRVK